MPRHCTRPVEHDAHRCGERYCLESLQAGKRCRCAVSAQGADARRLMVCRIQQPRPRSSLGRSRGPALSVRCARHGVGDEGVGGAARRRRASRQGGRAAVSGSACGCSPHSLTAGGKRSGAGCGGSEGCGRGAGRFTGRATPVVTESVPAIASPAAASSSAGRASSTGFSSRSLCGDTPVCQSRLATATAAPGYGWTIS